MEGGDYDIKGLYRKILEEYIKSTSSDKPLTGTQIYDIVNNYIVKEKERIGDEVEKVRKDINSVENQIKDAKDDIEVLLDEIEAEEIGRKYKEAKKYFVKELNRKSPEERQHFVEETGHGQKREGSLGKGRVDKKKIKFKDDDKLLEIALISPMEENPIGTARMQDNKHRKLMENIMKNPRSEYRKNLYSEDISKSSKNIPSGKLPSKNILVVKS